MTKTAFRAAVTAMLEELISTPDDIWDAGYLTMRLKTKEGETVVVSIEESAPTLDAEPGA